MITNRDVADKKNEVTMLRLERDEMLIRQQLDRAKQKSELTDASALREANETIHNAKTYIDDLEQDVTKYKTTIDELNETISDLRMAASDMLDTINECARGEAEDSMVLMKVVKAVDTWHRCMIPTSLTGCTDLIKVLDDVLEDYSNAPESPVVTLKTPSIGTRVVSKNEETHTIDENKMEAVRLLVACENDWILHTDSEAAEVRQQKGTINKLNALLANEKMTLAAYRSNPLSDQVADRDNRIEQLMVLNEALRIDIDGRDKHIEELTLALAAYREQNINQHNKLERIENFVDGCVIFTKEYIIDEITKIIREE